MLQPANLVLYHGTAETINQIDVTKGRNNKDFGRGFYMAVSKSQAIGMMHKKYREALARRPNAPKNLYSEILYEIQLNLNYLNTLNIKKFDSANEEWLDFILLCREQGGIPHNYDVVIGPTADDDTMVCLNSYWRGFYGEVGSDDAKEKLLNYLEPENLEIQYFIGRQEIADKLILSIKEVQWS